jgi:hypothetical protein
VPRFGLTGYGLHGWKASNPSWGEWEEELMATRGSVVVAAGREKIDEDEV